MDDVIDARRNGHFIKVFVRKNQKESENNDDSSKGDELRLRVEHTEEESPLLSPNCDHHAPRGHGKDLLTLPYRAYLLLY